MSTQPNTAQHSPGPWAHRIDVDGRDIIVSEPTETILVRHDPWLMPVKAEVEANARLIAAAPELLDSAKELVRALDAWSVNCPSDVCDAIHDMIGKIAKATQP